MRTTLFFPLLFCFSAVWRATHDAQVRATVKAIESALGRARISGKEAAAEVGMSLVHWQAMVKRGGNLAALTILGARRPDFRAFLREAMAPLDAIGDRRVARLDAIAREAQKCEGPLPSDLSAASYSPDSLVPSFQTSSSRTRVATASVSGASS